MPEEKAYHLKINGKGYIIVDESYAVQPQRPFNPRFSTGDPSLGDLSFWQFLAQEDFSGGEGQEIFESTSKYRASAGWDLRGGKARLAYTPAILSATNAPPALSNTNRQPASIVHFGGAIVVVYPTADAAFTVTTLKSASASDNQPAIYHVNGYCTAVFLRDAQSGDTDENFLAVGNGVDIRIFNEGMGTVATVTHGTAGLCIQAIQQVSTNKIAVAGTAGAQFNGAYFFSVLSLTGGTWNISNTLLTYTDDDDSPAAKGCVAPHMGLDSNGTLYFATSCLEAENGRSPSRIYRVVSADLAVSYGTISAYEVRDDIQIVDMYSHRGTIYLFGVRVAVDSTAQRVIVKYPGTTVWEGPIRTGTAAQHLYNSLFSIVPYVGNGVYFLTDNTESTSGDAGIPLRFLDGATEAVYEVAAFEVAFGGSATGIFVAAPYNGRFYCIDAVGGKLYRTGTTRGPSAAKQAILRLSELGGNTPLIEKALYKVIIELSEAMPDSHSLDILINGSLVGSVVAANGTRVELTPTAAIVGASFSPAIRAQQGTRFGGYVKRISVQYLPVQLKKLAWGFAVRAHRGMRCLNGQFEPRSPAEILSDLKDAWASNTPIEYVDVDGKVYSVVMTEWKGRQPLQADKRQDREFLIPVELLEV